MKKFEELFYSFFKKEFKEEYLYKKPLEIEIDSIKFWEFIGFLEENLNIELDMFEVMENDNLYGLKELVKKKGEHNA